MSVSGSRGAIGGEDTKPPRGRLSPDVEQAAFRIHTRVWGEPYRPGEGPMHHAGGPYWREELLRLAGQWEREAACARLCAGVLPVGADLGPHVAAVSHAPCKPEDDSGSGGGSR